MAKKTYVVKEKDNLASLSKALGVSIREIQQANGIRNLTPGQTLTVPASRSNGVGASGNAGGYSVTTGDNERKTINYNGTDIRLGPNSTFAPKNDKNKFKQFIDIITGNAPSQPGGFNGVRGSLPSTPKSIPGLASPTQYTGTGLGVNSQIGGYQQANQQTYFGSYGQGAPFSANQNMLRQQALGIQPQAPVQLPGRYNPMAAVPQQQNMLQQNAQNVFTGLSNNANIGPMRAPNTFSYAPQGQPNSYTPYSRQGAPFLTSAMMANPTYGNAPTAPKTNYGSYANGTAITAQESFQQGNKNVGKRWWIGRNRQDDGGAAAAAAALAAQQAAELAANQAITMNPGSVQQATLRPVY